MFIRILAAFALACAAATVAHAQPTPGKFTACQLVNGDIYLRFDAVTTETMAPAIAKSEYGVTRARPCRFTAQGRAALKAGTANRRITLSAQDKEELADLIEHVADPSVTNEQPAAGTTCRLAGALVTIRKAGVEVLPGEATRFPNAPACAEG